MVLARTRWIHEAKFPLNSKIQYHFHAGLVLVRLPWIIIRRKIERIILEDDQSRNNMGSASVPWWDTRFTRCPGTSTRIRILELLIVEVTATAFPTKNSTGRRGRDCDRKSRKKRRLQGVESLRWSDSTSPILKRISAWVENKQWHPCRTYICLCISG
jgi:hypothetical protein